MGFTNPGQTLGRSSLLWISRRLLTLSGIPPFSINSSRLASILALLVGLNLSFLTGALVCFFKITKSRSFRVRRGVPQGSVLGPVFFSFFINNLSAYLPSSVSCSLYADDLAIWTLQRWRPHKELCFDWSAGLSTGVFLSIQANVRPPSSQWIPTRLTSSPTSSYSAPASVSIPLQLFLGSPSTALSLFF